MTARPFKITSIFREPEFALVAVPVVFLVITKIWFSEATVDIHVHDTMFVISTSFIIVLLLILMISYFLMHGYLRTTNGAIKGSAKFMLSLQLFVC
jgi:hypothetical protein